MAVPTNTVESILELYKDNDIPLRNIAEEYEVSIGYITRLAQENGLGRRAPYAVRTPELNKAIIEEVRNGTKISVIGDKYGVSRTFITQTYGFKTAYKDRKDKLKVTTPKSSKESQLQAIFKSIKDLVEEAEELMDDTDVAEPTPLENPVKGSVDLLNPVID